MVIYDAAPCSEGSHSSTEQVFVDKRQFSGPLNSEEIRMGLLTFSLNVTLDGCVDHQEGIADDETHTSFTRLMDEGWGDVVGPHHLIESYWPAVVRGDVEAPPTVR